MKTREQIKMLEMAKAAEEFLLKMSSIDTSVMNSIKDSGIRVDVNFIGLSANVERAAEIFKEANRIITAKQLEIEYWSPGKTRPGAPGNFTTATITRPGYTHFIEIYGETGSEAEQVRDIILNTLQGKS